MSTQQKEIFALKGKVRFSQKGEDFLLKNSNQEEELSITSVHDSQTLVNHNDDNRINEDLNSDQEESYGESSERDGYEMKWIDEELIYYKKII